MSFFSWGFGGGYSASSGVDDANGGAGGCLPYIPFKRTERVGYTKPLTEYIVQSYAEPPEAYRDDLRVLDELRESATMSTTATSSDVNPSTLQRNIRYYGQLTFMLAKFPANIEVQFKWYSALDPNDTVSSADLCFERTAVLFNIGVIYFRMGQREMRSDPDSLARALNHFQNAAGVFEHLREKCIGECRSTLTADLSSCHLTCLESIALALAQECAWKSAVIKGFKDGTVARLAMQVVVLYDNALEAAQNPDAPSVVSRYWGNYISIKKLYFEAEARNRKAIEALSNSQHGQEVAQLQLARDAINEAYQIIEEDKTRAMRKLNPMLVNEIKSFRNTILETTQRAVSDNDIIYLDAVPPPSSLPPIMPAKMTRPSLPEIIASPENFSGESDLGSPLFKALLPFVVHEAASVYEDRKEQLVVRDIIASLDELTAQSENILSSLNLPYALEAVEKPIGVPPSLLSASDQIRSEGGLNALRRLVITIKRHRSSATEILKKSQEALDAELAEDNELRQTHSDSDFVRSRTPSSELTVGLRTQLQHYSAILAKAKESDNSMEGMLETWGGYIGILSLPRDELEQKIPSTTGSSIDDPHHALVIERLHGFLDEVKEMTRQRRANIKELRQFAASDDIGPALNTEMARLSAASSTPIMKFELYHFEDLFNSRLEEYRKWSQYVEDEREAQKELLDCIQEANQAFISARKNHPQLEARESMLANLELAARHFNMLSSNLHEGIKFYDDLKVQLDKLNNSCLDFALARQMDITEMTGGNDDHDRGNGGYRQYTDTTSTASPNPTTWDPSMPLQYISRPRKN